MAQEHLATYLNDHLAGSVVALELLEHLEATYSENTLRDFFRKLRADIAADRDELEALMKVVNIDQSRTRKASAWLAEKFPELKLRFDDPKAGALLLFESLEALSLGIKGKRSLAIHSTWHCYLDSSRCDSSDHALTADWRLRPFAAACTGTT